MNFKTFAVGATNVFPASNTHNGGQLLTEFNLRSRESVETHQSIKYVVGPSFVHSADDFNVTYETDELGVKSSTTRFVIHPGRGVINGHYVQTLAPMTIDISEANAFINDYNASVQTGESKLSVLRGQLCVGIRMMYSSEASMAGSILPEDGQDIYEGIQVVVLPKSEFRLPTDVPGSNQQSLVNAHIKLAELSFKNGEITGIINNYPDKCFMIDGNRIRDLESCISGKYADVANLDPSRLYVLAGRGYYKDSKGNTITTWHDGTGRLMIWDNNSGELISEDEAKRSGYPIKAEFEANAGDDEVNLVIPHDVVMTTTGKFTRPPARITLPNANYESRQPGVVGKDLLDKLKKMDDRIEGTYTLTNGKQIAYIDQLDQRHREESGNTSSDRNYLPDLSDAQKVAASGWTTGDYVLVREDRTVSSDLDASFPSTMYVLIPGKVRAIEADETTSAAFDALEILNKLSADVAELQAALSEASSAKDSAADSLSNIQSKVSTLIDEEITIHSQLNKAIATRDAATNAFEIAKAEGDKDTTDEDDVLTKANEVVSALNDKHTEIKTELGTASSDLMTALDAFESACDKYQAAQLSYAKKYNEYIGAIEVTSKYDGHLYARSIMNGVQIDIKHADRSEVNPADITAVSTLFGIRNYSGSVGDYFTLVIDEEHYYYYRVCEADSLSYSEPIYLTRQIPFATQHQVGGFYNADETDIDKGYVCLDENGHLVLVDYALLRSGILAYQLGENQTHDAGISNSAINNWLVEYVNQRVAFPNLNHLKYVADEPAKEQYSRHSNVIEVTINLSDADTSTDPIEIFDIDSRFGTSIYLKVIGTAPTSGTVINISNCQKIRIDNNIPDNVEINLYRSCLYYDSQVLDRLNEIQDMTLWYAKFNPELDPNIVVSDMTVRIVEAPQYIQELSYWNTENVNDNHYKYALQSLTFGSDGSILGCSIYMRNDTTANAEEGTSIVISDFSLPDDLGLSYPKSKLKTRMKITGSFVTAYRAKSRENANSTEFNTYVVMNTQFTAISQYYESLELVPVPGQISIMTNTQYVPITDVTMMLSDNNTYVDEDHPWQNNFHVFSGSAVGIGDASKV